MNKLKLNKLNILKLNNNIYIPFLINNLPTYYNKINPINSWIWEKISPKRLILKSVELNDFFDIILIKAFKIAIKRIVRTKKAQ